VITATPRGLVFSSDTDPGIARRRRGRGFSYLYPDSTAVNNDEDLSRIKQLVIPPAYQNVWICLDPHGHIQATGLDAKRRKQYCYHPQWHIARTEQKFEHLLEFGESLHEIREQVEADLSLHHFPKQKVVALVVRLLDQTLIRVGNEAYARENKTFGLTTLTSNHVDVNTNSIEFNFVGKSGKKWSIKTRDRRLARIVRTMQDLPGQKLFQYINEFGDTSSVSSHDVNTYLSEIAHGHITAKDFRTWAASREALRMFLDTPAESTDTARKRRANAIIRQIADMLGNTPAVCRSSYIHPAVIQAGLEGTHIYHGSRLDPDHGLLQFLRRL